MGSIVARGPDVDARVSDLARVLVEGDESAPIATVIGEIDLSNAEELEERLGRLADSAAGLVVDLSEVSYLDSAGIRLIFRLSETLSSRSGRLCVVVGPDSPLRRVLVLSRADAVVALSDSREGALAHFSSG